MWCGAARDAVPEQEAGSSCSALQSFWELADETQVIYTTWQSLGIRLVYSCLQYGAKGAN